jgi:hypothetical protein
VDRAFDMSGAEFAQVPAFNQADFKQAPDLDSVTFPLPRFWLGGEADNTAKFRAIRRIAIQGADYEREQMAFKGELRSKRISVDWPWHLTFWFGAIYDIFADFGRPVVRPFFAWALCIITFAIYFLRQSREMMAERKKLHRHGFLGQIVAYSTVALDAAREVPAPFCYPHTPPSPGTAAKEVQNGFTGLVDEVRAATNLVNEALSVAYHTAVIILHSSGDSAHRAFGCLYGVERYGGIRSLMCPATWRLRAASRSSFRRCSSSYSALPCATC